MLVANASFACEQTLKVGIGQPWPPYVFKGERTLSGIDIDITRLVLKKAGFCSQFVLLPSSIRGLVELKKGTVDVLPAASYSDDRAKYSHFSLPYRRERMRLFWYENSAFIKHDLQHLMHSSKTFVINSGGYYGEEFAQLSQQADYKNLIVPVKMINQRLLMLKAKRVDFMIDDEVSGLYLMAQKNITGISLHPYIVNDNPIHFMFSNKTVNTAQSQKIDDAIKQLETPITEIIDNYTQ